MISIIIPTHNLKDQLAVCLRKVRETTDPREVEVIVVSNGCTDRTERVAKQYGVVYDRLDENKGFAVACNHGARMASDGNDLLFLNNDCEVTAGWLDAMGRGWIGEDGIVDPAIVGPQLLYPSGKIQAAGMVTYAEPYDRDITGYGLYYRNYLKQQLPSHPKNVSGPRKCTTGACMLVPRDCWDDVGGFDERYWNGFEDVDLCFAAINAGWRVWYCRESIVVHHESMTDKKLRQSRRAENKALCAGKWQGVIDPEFERLEESGDR